MLRKLIIAGVLLSLAGVVAIFIVGDFRHKLLQQTLVDIQGVSHQLLDGKPVLVNVWATDCPSCVDEMPKLNKLHADYSEQGFRVIAVAMQYDNLSAIRKFVSSLGLDFPIVYDVDDTIVKAVAEVYAIPMSFLVNSKGLIIAQSVGEPNWRSWRLKIEDMLETSIAY